MVAVGVGVGVGVGVSVGVGVVTVGGGLPLLAPLTAGAGEGAEGTENTLSNSLALLELSKFNLGGVNGLGPNLGCNRTNHKSNNAISYTLTKIGTLCISWK